MCRNIRIKFISCIQHLLRFLGKRMNKTNPSKRRNNNNNNKRYLWQLPPIIHLLHACSIRPHYTLPFAADRMSSRPRQPLQNACTPSAGDNDVTRTGNRHVRALRQSEAFFSGNWSFSFSASSMTTFVDKISWLEAVPRSTSGQASG